MLGKRQIPFLFHSSRFIFFFLPGQEQLLKDLVMLPVRADTLSIQKRRVELERKLSQIEEALKIFSRPKVFIKMDS